MDHSPPPERPPARRFLFLQGPISPFFAELAAALRARGHATHRINLSLGDRLFWRGPGATDFHGRPEAWPGFVGRFLDANAITDLVLLAEQRPYHRAAIRAARARGIAVTVTDFGYIRPDWIVLERDGMGPESRFPRDPAAIRALAALCPPFDDRVRFADDFALQARWDVLFHLAGLVRLPGLFRHYRSYLLHHPLPNYLGTALQLLRRRRLTARAAQLLGGAGPAFLFAMQMENDYSVRAYSPFADNDAALRLTIESFARAAPDRARLLVKVHPLDPGLKRWPRRIARLAAAAGVADRVAFLGGALPADAAIEAAAGVVTINSTLGLRAIALGRPVLTLGEALYDIPGLTWQGAPDGFWTGAAPPDAGLAADFLRAIAGCLHIRGCFYARPGLDAAVAAAAERLHGGAIGLPLPEAAEPKLLAPA